MAIPWVQQTGPARNAGAGRAHWRGYAPLPLTTISVLLLCAAASFFDLDDGDVPDAVAWASTNLHNLASHPVAAMLASMFVVTGSPWSEVVLVALGCGLVEHHLGAGRAALVALSGQTVATVLTEYGSVLFGRMHLTGMPSALRSDVGVSYAMYALLGAAVAFVPRRLAAVTLIALTASVAMPLFLDPEMTTAGHAVSLGCGLIAAVLVVVRRARVAEEPGGKVLGVAARHGASISCESEAISHVSARS